VVVHFAAYTVSCFEHNDRFAAVKEVSRCCEARETGTDDGNIH
jgi:hypothetical protein